ncbi:hypothetical protein Trco_003783 [Trichoderma cornu-damae]|uniref:Uncharacterized protein n=1 Tax=Trichoderma cornu-damae TaxID=654480 RepID=A0A9P8QPX1_9HYPO|nr:hypothetical protein Trco_003783 [Trichoderma cornu-damae]
MNDADASLGFGYLYDLAIDVLPTLQSSIVQTICPQPFPATMPAGSSILFLVQVVLRSGAASAPRQHKHTRQRSDELMEDLQRQLGDSLAPYMKIQVSYSHSAFRSQLTAAGGTEVSALHTKLTTTVEATVKLHNIHSPWSPHPVLGKDRLLALIERHWGSQKASEAMQQMQAQRCTPIPAPTETALEGNEKNTTQRIPNHSCSPVISPGRISSQELPETMANSNPSTHPERCKRVSHDSGIGMRGASGSRVSVAGNRGKEEKRVSLQVMCSVPPDIIGRLTPALASDGGGDGQDGGKDCKSSDNTAKGKKHGAVGEAKAKKEPGFWTWAAWF